LCSCVCDMDHESAIKHYYYYYYYLNVETSLFFAPPLSKFLTTCLVEPRLIC